MKFDVEVDVNGVQMVVTDPNYLQVFERFINLVEERAIGQSDGVFKIAIKNVPVRCTTLQRLTDIVTKKLNMNKYIPPVQRFVSVSLKEDVYEYQKCEPVPLTQYQRKFQKVMSDVSTYKNVNTCCTRIMEEGDGRALLKHYFDVLRNSAVSSLSVKSDEEITAMLFKGEQDCAAHELKLQNLSDCVEKSASVSMELSSDEASDIEPDSSVSSDESDTEKPVVKHPKKRCEPIIYCSHVLKGSKNHLEIFPNFSLSRLNTILDLIPQKYPGLTWPYIYYGTTHSSFAAHWEDECLWSISYNHYGAPKIWIVIPPEYAGLFHFHVSKERINPDHASCRNLLGHKVVIVDTDYLDARGIPYKIVVQNPGEFVVLYPCAVHLGFNTGPGYAEAINFATVSYLPVGINAPNCTCFGRAQIHLDLSSLLAAYRKDLLFKYLGRETWIKNLTEDPLLVRTPPAVQKCQLVQLKVEDDQIENEDHSQSSCNDLPQNVDVTCQEEEDLPEKVIGRILLHCTICSKTYKGGGGRIKRLVRHLKRKHSASAIEVDAIVKKYVRKKVMSTVPKKLCPQCGSLFSKTYHLNRHLKNSCLKK